MKIELLGKKLGMSQVYDDDNNLVPVTIVEAGPCPVLQVKTDEKDGYSAVQIGFNPKGRSPNKVNSCKKGQAAKAGVDPQNKQFFFFLISISQRYKIAHRVRS